MIYFDGHEKSNITIYTWNLNACKSVRKYKYTMSIKYD
jgi:hypothetical protein